MSITQAKATLRLRSDTATAAQVTHRLGLVPSFSAERGEPITPRHPTRLRDRSLWLLDSRLDDHQPLHHHLADLLDQLAGKQPALTDLAVSYDIDWFCLAATDNTQGSVELPHELIARLPAFPGHFVLDLYTGQDQPPDLQTQPGQRCLTRHQSTGSAASWRRPGCPPSPIWRSRTRAHRWPTTSATCWWCTPATCPDGRWSGCPGTTPQYGRAADAERVVDAVRASMSIPFYFRPVDVQTANGTVTWVDGGLLSNFPITVFDRTDGKQARWPTWG